MADVSSTHRESKLFYDQVQASTTTRTQVGTADSNRVVSGRTDRALESVADSVKNSSEQANVGFKISFSITLLGRIPSNGKNC